MSALESTDPDSTERARDRALVVSLFTGPFGALLFALAPSVTIPYVVPIAASFVVVATLAMIGALILNTGVENGRKWTVTGG